MIPLSLKSTFSFLEGTLKLEDIINYAIKNNLQAIGVADRNGLYGVIEFHEICKEKGIKPITGARISYGENEQNELLLIAKNLDGYITLSKTITTKKLDPNFNVINFFSDNESPNLIKISCDIEFLKKSKDRKNLYCELFSSVSYKKRNRELISFAKQNSLQVVASCYGLFFDEEGWKINQILTAIKKRTTLDNLEQENILPLDLRVRNINEYKKLWYSLPEAIYNTIKISNECNLDLEIGKYKFPEFQNLDGKNSRELLYQLSFDALTRRYKKPNDKIINRLIYELDVINELNFNDYFLVVWDILQECKRRGIITIGRGSAANSLVSYCLGFTEVDPIKYNLYFERFLNRGRKTPPDIDIDFSWRERDEIVKYVFDKYGYEHVAMISTHVTFKARSAFREVAKVYGFSDREISKYSKFIPWTSAKNLPEIINKFPEAKNLPFNEEPWKTIVFYASKLSDFPHHISIHASGIVISPKPIVNYVPLEYAKNKGLGLIVTQPDMYSIEDLGLVKIDLLSQRSLGVLRDSLSKIYEKNNLIFV